MGWLFQGLNEEEEEEEEEKREREKERDVDRWGPVIEGRNRRACVGVEGSGTLV